MTQIIRWNPMRDMEMLHQQMNRLFEPVFGRQGVWNDPDLASGTWVPAVDIEETPERLVVRAEVPGMKAEDLDVRVENGTLTIAGERKFETERGDRHFHRVERSYGRFSRSFTLPTTISTEEVDARYENGVLELTMKKREEAKPRRIEITSRDRNAIDTSAR